MAQHGLHNARKAAAPVIAVLGEHPDAFAIPLHDQAVAVLLDLMQPFRAGGNLGPPGRNAGQNSNLRIWQI